MGNCKIPENPAEMGFFPTGIRILVLLINILKIIIIAKKFI